MFPDPPACEVVIKKSETRCWFLQAGEDPTLPGPVPHEDLDITQQQAQKLTGGDKAATAWGPRDVRKSMAGGGELPGVLHASHNPGRGTAKACRMGTAKSSGPWESALYSSHYHQGNWMKGYTEHVVNKPKWTPEKLFKSLTGEHTGVPHRRPRKEPEETKQVMKYQT